VEGLGAGSDVLMVVRHTVDGGGLRDLEPADSLCVRRSGPAVQQS
jgi:hypothetical protein